MKRGLLSPMGKPFTNVIVFSIYKKCKVREERVNRDDTVVWLNKPQTKSIMKLLKMGKSNRDIIGRLNCSPKTITKCRNHLKKDLVSV